MRYRKNNSLKIPKWLHPGEKTIDVSAKQKGINSLDYFNYGFCAKEIEYTEAWSPIEIALLSDEDSNHPEEYKISQNEEKLLRKIYQGLDNQLLYIEPKDFNEESVIRTVLTPLLWMTGFYETPFHIRSEEQISFLKSKECDDNQHADTEHKITHRTFDSMANPVGTSTVTTARFISACSPTVARIARMAMATTNCTRNSRISMGTLLTIALSVKKDGIEAILTSVYDFQFGNIKVIHFYHNAESGDNKLFS